jgi:RNA polymerase sigma-70 factor (ECF subfamily)
VEPQVPLHERGDDALVAAAGRGEREALHVLVERWGRRVHAFLRRALASSHDADDLTQETFLRLWRAAPRYRAQGRFAAWLFRIAGNLARQEMRRRRLRALLLGETQTSMEDVLDSLPAPAAFDPESPLRAEEIRRALATALAKLPARQRLAVLLRFYEEMSTAEIAAALGTSPRAAESLLARGTRRLRQLLRSMP